MHVAVAPNKYVPGWPGNPSSDYERMPLVEALERVYPTDAHLVAYVVDTPATHQPRLRKDSAPSYPLPARVHVLFADIDHPNRAKTTPEMLDTVALETEGIYWTEHGYRLVQPLLRPVPALESEPTLWAWLTALAARGIGVDWACRDWTRHFRLPNVRKKGRLYLSPRIDLSRMVPIDIAPMAPPVGARRKRATKPATGPAPVFVAALPDAWQQRAELVARGSIVAAGGRHRYALALSGALLAAGVPEDIVPAFVRAVASLTGAADPGHHEHTARQTVDRRRMGIPISGLDALRAEWPGAADALVVPSAPAPVVTPPRSIADTLRAAGDGVSMIAAECGLGKTRAAEEVARDAAGMAKKLGSKTAISVDKHSLAKQVTEHLRADNVDVVRFFGPLAVEGCVYRKTAEPLVAGGQSLRKDFCEGRNRAPCAHRETCTVRRGYEGDLSARVAVGPHALLKQLDGHAGSTGLLVIDEPPALLETVALVAADLVMAERNLPDFESAYANAMGPILAALRAWVESEAAPDIDALRRACPDDERPPIRWSAMHRARDHYGSARNLGAASRVLGVVGRIRDPNALLRVEAERLWVSAPGAGLVRALVRAGRTVVLDASAGLNRALYARVIGYEPPLHSFPANDGCTVERTLFRMRASRTAWVGENAPPSLQNAIRRVFGWAGGVRLGVVTFAPLTGILAQMAESYPGEIRIAHYGGIRGLDSWADLDALATLGDPRPNLVAAEAEAAWAAGPRGAEAGACADARVDALARAELEQAHGRLRLVHRTTPAKACHVGSIWPGGSGWTLDRVRVVEVGDRPRRDVPADLRSLVAERGIATIAADFGIGKNTIRRRLTEDG